MTVTMIGVSTYNSAGPFNNIYIILNLFLFKYPSLRQRKRIYINNVYNNIRTWINAYLN